MPRPDNLPEPAHALLSYVDAHPAAEAAQAIVEIILSSTHPDFVMSLTTARLLPIELRRIIADFLHHVLIEGLGDEHQRWLYAWAQDAMLVGL